ncbi:DUF2277 family protein [Phytohabitans flavus]|uniref:DUF2277 family protein n=1 Tax=Phytohabitans flavus TaxID=1076124 RepID=UPI0036250547
MTLREPFVEEVTEADIQAAALQYVRKISGFRTPAAHNADAFNAAVAAVADATRTLLDDLVVRPSPNADSPRCGARRPARPGSPPTGVRADEDRRLSSRGAGRARSRADGCCPAPTATGGTPPTPGTARWRSCTAGRWNGPPLVGVRHVHMRRAERAIRHGQQVTARVERVVGDQATAAELPGQGGDHRDLDHARRRAVALHNRRKVTRGLPHVADNRIRRQLGGIGGAQRDHRPQEHRFERGAQTGRMNPGVNRPGPDGGRGCHNSMVAVRHGTRGRCYSSVTK